MNTFVLLVTGARTRTDRDTIWAALDAVVTEALANGYEWVVVRYGGAGRGADALAQIWVKRRAGEGWPVVADRHPADWKRHGQRAGVIRNAAMLAADPAPDDVLAFPDPCPAVAAACRDRGEHETHGTTDCAQRAERLSIPVTWVGRDAVATDG